MREREGRFRTMAPRILILHDPDSSPNSYLHLFAGFDSDNWIGGPTASSGCMTATLI